uniref:Uncharacterized protein n=1 Tax=Arundo donax TaxID=35708 RepID=A0A0A9GM23_ARUDO
MRVWAFLGSSK